MKHKPNFKTRNLIVIGLIYLTVGITLLWQEDILFYGRLYYAYRRGQQFYTSYQGLSRDIPFHPQMSPRLDIYSPYIETQRTISGPLEKPTPQSNALPVFIYIHGGLEKYATKELFAAVAMKLVPHNVVVVIPDYTLYPQADYHYMTHEVAAAISWTLENIAQYGGNPKQVLLVGHSSGAYLGMLALLDEQFFKSYGHTATELCGLISVSGSYNIPQQYTFEQTHGGNTEQLLKLMPESKNFMFASPINYVRPNIPPILIIHGRQDKTVPLNIATSFQTALQSVGAKSRLKIYPHSGHTDFLFKALSADDSSPIITDFIQFMHNCKTRD